MPRRLFHYFCVLLLLVAQQGALAHAAWHAAGGPAHARDAHDAHDRHDGDAHAHHGDAHDHQDTHDRHGDSSDGQAHLCALDLAFGQVLGGAHGACTPPVVAEMPAVVATYIFNPRLGTEAVPAQSRGPPVIL